MSSERVSPNEVSFSAGISACEKGDRWQVALEILSEMATSEASPNVFSYSACISACERASQWQLALVLLAQMFTAGIVPDQIILNTLLTARDKGTQWEMAFYLFWATWRGSEHCTPPHTSTVFQGYFFVGTSSTLVIAAPTLSSLDSSVLHSGS